MTRAVMTPAASWTSIAGGAAGRAGASSSPERQPPTRRSDERYGHSTERRSISGAPLPSNQRGAIVAIP
jgi:hypothetical protein